MFFTVVPICFTRWKVLATASAVSRANMATSDWLRRFDFDRVFWSNPGEQGKKGGETRPSGGEGLGNVPATQQSVYEGLGARIVEDALNVSAACDV